MDDVVADLEAEGVAREGQGGVRVAVGSMLASMVIFVTIKLAAAP
jgi:hypothetical protein